MKKDPEKSHRNATYTTTIDLYHIVIPTARLGQPLKYFIFLLIVFQKAVKNRKKKINQILDIKDIKHIFTTSKLGQNITACIKTSISAVHNCTLDLNWSNIQLQIKRKVYKCANEILEICCRKCIYGTVVRTLLLFACFSFWGENPFVKCNLLFNFWVLSFYVRREH